MMLLLVLMSRRTTIPPTFSCKRILHDGLVRRSIPTLNQRDDKTRRFRHPKSHQRRRLLFLFLFLSLILPSFGILCLDFRLPFLVDCTQKCQST